MEKTGSDFKTSDRAPEQGVNQRESAAYKIVGEHFEKVHNIVMGCSMGV